MNKYIKLIVDKNYRFHVLARKGFFDWMDDETYLKKMYKCKMEGKDLNLSNPKTFNEKIQWLKIYDRNPMYAVMVDKYEAKEYIKNILGVEYIVPTYGVWDSFEQINFDNLPHKFVLKCTHDSGGLAICKNKDEFDVKLAKKNIKKSFNYQFYKTYREWAYKNVKPRIICEQYLDTGDKPLIDYKFFCFNGRPEFLYASEGLENHETAKISFFDLSGNLLPFHRSDYRPFDTNLELPENFEEMKIIAEKIATATELSFVRIDLYNVDNHIYFSEITLYPNAGFIPFEPKEWDERLGEMMTLPSIK